MYNWQKNHMLGNKTLRLHTLQGCKPPTGLLRGQNSSGGGFSLGKIGTKKIIPDPFPAGKYQKLIEFWYANRIIPGPLLDQQGFPKKIKKKFFIQFRLQHFYTYF